VANYAKSKLPVGHIVIGIPAYGYHGTLGSYSMTIDTYAESSTLPGFSTRKVNSEGEETWMVGNTYYCDQPPSALDMKKTLLESLGIQNISVWHIGGNNWF
jgi:spore germination protein YaaH